MDKLQKKRLSKVSPKAHYQAHPTDIVYGRNLDATNPPPLQNPPMEHDWRFVIPNIRENANIFIGTYVRAHDSFANVVQELNHLSRSNSEEEGGSSDARPETHDIEIIE
jgi:hypothetical protein